MTCLLPRGNGFPAFNVFRDTLKKPPSARRRLSPNPANAPALTPPLPCTGIFLRQRVCCGKMPSARPVQGIFLFPKSILCAGKAAVSVQNTPVDANHGGRKAPLLTQGPFRRDCRSSFRSFPAPKLRPPGKAYGTTLPPADLPYAAADDGLPFPRMAPCSPGPPAGRMTCLLPVQGAFRYGKSFPRSFCSHRFPAGDGKREQPLFRHSSNIL